MNQLINRRNMIVLAGSAWIGSRASAAGASTVEWRLATGYSAESFQTVNIFAMARDIARATQGSLNVTVYANNTLAKLNDVPAAVRSGGAEAGEVILTSLVNDIPIAGADSVPFIVSSYADARRLWRFQRPLLDRHFAERGLKLLYAVPWPPQGLYTNKPIASTQDFKGARMRTYNPTTARIASMLGATGVDVPMVDVGRALAEGRIDSMITSAVTGVENKVWNHLKYYYEINAWFPKNVVFASTKAVEALQAGQQQALAQAAEAAELRGWAASEAAAAQSVDDLRQHGMKIDRVPRDFAVDLKRLGERLSLEWIRKVGPQANDIFIPYFA